MAQTLTIDILLGAAHAGLDLEAQIYDSGGAAYGSRVTTGFSEIGGGAYAWFYDAYPDDWRGSVAFYDQLAPAVVLAATSINPVDFTPNPASQPSGATTPFTYDPTVLTDATAAGRLAKTRLLIGDTVNTVDQPGIFDDYEVALFLADGGNDCYAAGALAYEAWARSRARIALAMERDGFKTQREAVKSLLAAASSLRSQAGGTSGAASGALQTGTITSSDQQYLDEMRPQWRDLDDIAVVE